MTRNVVAPETAEQNRSRPGAFTFNAEIPADYDGPCFAVAAVRLGDHAHLDVSSGRHLPARPGQYRGRILHSNAGKLVFAWDDWLLLREMLDQHENVLVREVESPTPGNLERHA